MTVRSDDILAQIDHALDDWTVSEDAMRHRPEDDPEGIRGFTPRVQIVDEVGQWDEIGCTLRLESERARRAHRPIWIDAHVKGPDGAPLLDPDKLVNVLRR
ncbi:hypothetical protein [Streptomyces sp. PD-S100-1]|uniref:hypothetical protein n=1 Tax=Streptomyces sp. PD-S100-1 TaxID=3394351 RepID=UPI0039BD245B